MEVHALGHCGSANIAMVCTWRMVVTGMFGSLVVITKQHSEHAQDYTYLKDYSYFSCASFYKKKDGILGDRDSLTTLKTVHLLFITAAIHGLRGLLRHCSEPSHLLS